jgi:glycosyltransferase involved in cell wall biosynthesis
LDCGFLNRPRSLRRWLLKKFWLDLPARSATVITTISEAARREIISWLGCSEDKVVVIPVAVSDNYQPVPREFQAECPRILQVGTAPNKNLLRSIEALRGIPCCLVIVGRLDPVVLETLGANSVHYENFVSLSSEKLLHQYHTSDIVLFPSTYEGFGMPIVEGQRVGRPVITSNISSMPEVAGRGAELVDPFSVDSIRQGILKVIQDRDHRDRLIHEGFQNATRFDAQRIADRYFEVYQTIESSSDFLKEKALD